MLGIEGSSQYWLVRKEEKRNVIQVCFLILRFSFLQYESLNQGILIETYSSKKEKIWND